MMHIACIWWGTAPSPNNILSAITRPIIIRFKVKGMTISFKPWWSA